MTSTNENKPSGAVVVFSGGQDSTTCLFWALQHFDHVYAITFQYGQKHAIELDAAKTIIELARRQYLNKTIDHEVLQVGPILHGTSPLVNPDEKLEQYEDGNLPGGLEKTFVPMRNQLFLTLAANRAFVQNCDQLITGVCQEDFGGYPDCRRTFIDALENAIIQGTFTEEAGFKNGITIRTPLMYLTKAESVHVALTTPGCYDALAWSHTAYDGQFPPTGHDHATVLRAKGFEEAGVPDPLILRAHVLQCMELPKTDNYGQEALRKYANSDMLPSVFL